MPVRMIGLLAVAGCFCACLVGCSDRPASNSPTSKPVAIVNGASITVATFQHSMIRRTGNIETLQQKQVLLEEMIRLEVLYQAARDAGYEQNPNIVFRIKRLMVNQLKKDTLEPQLSALEITDREIEDYYLSHPQEFATPAMVHAAVIRIRLPARVSEEKKKQLLEKARTARLEALGLKSSIRSFGGVAVKYSDDQATRYRGGDAGWLRVDKPDRRFEKGVLEAISALSVPGQISPIIETPTGYYIIRLMETKESQTHLLSTVKDRIYLKLLNQHKAKIEREFYNKLKSKAKIKINREILADIKIPAGGLKKQTAPPALPGQ